MLLVSFFCTVLDGIAGGMAYSIVRDVPVGMVLFIRSVCSSLFFFVIAVVLFGWTHVYEAFHPEVAFYTFLWSGIYNVSAISFWFAGIAHSTPLHISLTGAITLPLALLFTYVFLHQTPTTAEVVGSLIIATGVAFSGVGQYYESKQSVSGDVEDGGDGEDGQVPLLHVSGGGEVAD